MLTWEIQANKSKAQELQELRDQHKSQFSEQGLLVKKAEERAAGTEKKMQQLEARCKELQERLRQSDDDLQKVRNLRGLNRPYWYISTNRTLSQLDGQLKEKEAERETVQGELDDLLMVYSDLEEKANQYKVSFGGAHPSLLSSCICADMLLLDRTDCDHLARPSRTLKTRMATRTKMRTRMKTKTMMGMTNPRVENMRVRLEVRRDKRTQRSGAARRNSS